MGNVYNYNNSGAGKCQICLMLLRSATCHERNVQNLWLHVVAHSHFHLHALLLHHISQLISCAGDCSEHMAAPEPPLPEKAPPTTCQTGTCSLIAILEFGFCFCFSIWGLEIILDIGVWIL